MTSSLTQQPIMAGVAMTGHETSSLAFELVLLPTSISEKLLEPYNASRKSLATKVKEIPQPMLGVLTEFLQQLQIDSKTEPSAASKDQRRKASLQLMVSIV